MDVNLLLGTSAIAGLATGIWGLVTFRKNGKNGNNGNNGNGAHVAEPGVRQEVARDLWQVDKLVEALQPLALLPRQLEVEFGLAVERLANALEAHVWQPEIPVQREPAAWPAEMMPLFERLVERLEQPPLPPAWPPGLFANLERLSERLETFIELPPPPPPELPHLDGLAEQIRELIDVERKRQAARSAIPPKALSEGEVMPVAIVSPTPAPPKPRESKPITRAAGPVILDEFNTLLIDQYTVYELRPPEAGVFQMNLLNLGPGWLYVRANAEPTIADPKATTLPPGAIDNEIRIAQRLYVLASEDGSIAVRLSH